MVLVVVFVLSICPHPKFVIPSRTRINLLHEPFLRIFLPHFPVRFGEWEKPINDQVEGVLDESIIEDCKVRGFQLGCLSSVASVGCALSVCSVDNTLNMFLNKVKPNNKNPFGYLSVTSSSFGISPDLTAFPTSPHHHPTALTAPGTSENAFGSMCSKLT